MPVKLDNFKELLLKKSEDNANLQLLIKYIRDDYLVDHVVESLEKMAASNSKKNPNASVLHFAKNMNSFKSGMIHDALSHHASHYKAALKAGKSGVADDHMRQIFKTMHMTEKFTKDGINDHSGGRLKISAIDTKPWERTKYNNTTNQKGDETGTYVTDTQGWKRHNVKDFNWLRQAPHPDSRTPGDKHYKAEVSTHGHNKAYPLEEIKVNDKHIHVDDDVEHTGEFTPHPLDSHPIYNHYNTKPNSHGADNKAEYLADREHFHTNEEGGKAKYKAKIAGMSKEDYTNRGSTKSSPVRDDVEGLDISSARPAPINREDLKSRLDRIKQMGKKND